MIRFNFSIQNQKLCLSLGAGPKDQAPQAHRICAPEFEVFFWHHDPAARPLLDQREVEHESLLLNALALFFDFMPAGPISLREAPNDLFSPNDGDHWIFFGGTFNPWHLGHRTCLELAKKFDPKANLILIPDRNPWKQVEQQQWSVFTDLRQYTQGLVAGVYPGFLTREKGNPTVDWLPFVRGQKSLLIGADHLRDFRRWKNYQELLSTLKSLLVCPRLIEAEKKEQSLIELQASLQAETNTPIILLEHHEYEHLSSSFLRKKSPE